MMDAKMLNALNKQINDEMFSGYLYLSMAAWFEEQNLPGFAGWMKKQAGEELGHAMKLYGYVGERQGRVELKEIAQPKSQWKSPLEAFEDALAHEKEITRLIHNLVNQSMEIRDHATTIFLQWFVTEQVEEEASADAFVQKLKMIGDAPHGLLILDREAGQRQ